MNKRFQKSAYDPGRFRHNLIFYREVSTVQPDGGTTLAFEQLLTAKAVKEAIPHRLNNFAELENNAGQSMIYHSCYFVIRTRLDFTPDQDILIATGGEQYTLRAIIDVDTPQNWWKLFCIKSGMISNLPSSTPVDVNTTFVTPVTLPVIPSGTASPYHLNMAPYAAYGKNPTIMVQVAQDGGLIGYSDIEIRRFFTDNTFTVLDYVEIYGHGITTFADDTYITIKV